MLLLADYFIFVEPLWIQTYSEMWGFLVRSIVSVANRFFKVIDKATSRSTLQCLNSVLELQANTVFDKTQLVFQICIWKKYFCVKSKLKS